MANKRKLKKNINQVCAELMIDAVAATLYGVKKQENNQDALLYTILKMQADFISRISHTEPGLPAKAYFNDLRKDFAAHVSDVADLIQNA